MKKIKFEISYCGHPSCGDLEIIASDGDRFQAVKIEPFYNKNQIAHQLRVLADNIERDRMMGEGDDRDSQALAIAYLGFGS